MQDAAEPVTGFLGGEVVDPHRHYFDAIQVLDPLLQSKQQTQLGTSVFVQRQVATEGNLFAGNELMQIKVDIVFVPNARENGSNTRQTATQRVAIDIASFDQLRTVFILISWLAVLDDQHR